LGAFGAISFTVGKYGFGSLTQLASLMGSFYLTCILFIGGVLGSICAFHGFSLLKLLKYIKEELFIVLGTATGEAAMPRLIAKLQNAGIEKSVVGLVVPTGYSFNLDGTSIYLTMAAIFIAQATNTPLDLQQQITMLLVMMLTSKGAAAVAGGGFIVLAATLASGGAVPVAGLALILGIDRFMAEARSLTNFIGNSVATVVVAKWCKALDMNRLTAVLNDETADEADSPELVLDEAKEPDVATVLSPVVDHH
jgi:aerobic C4-dicarboxylate transport protein